MLNCVSLNTECCDRRLQHHAQRTAQPVWTHNISAFLTLASLPSYLEMTTPRSASALLSSASLKASMACSVIFIKLIFYLSASLVSPKRLRFSNANYCAYMIVKWDKNVLMLGRTRGSCIMKPSEASSVSRINCDHRAAPNPVRNHSCRLGSHLLWHRFLSPLRSANRCGVNQVHPV